MPPLIRVCLLPFERTLIENVAKRDKSLANFINDPRNALAVTKLFERWETAVSVRGAIDDLEDGLSDANSVPSLQRREICYHAFLGILGLPQESNQCRADIFDKNNQPFKESLLLAQDISLFLKLARRLIRIDDTDAGHWKIIGAMILKFPEEMERWTFDIPLPFEFLQKPGGRFEIWQVVRMYVTYLVDPYAGRSLLDLWTTSPHNSLGVKIWEEKQEEHERSQKGWEKLLEQVLDLEPREEGDESSLDDLIEIGEEDEDEATLEVC